MLDSGSNSTNIDEDFTIEMGMLTSPLEKRRIALVDRIAYIDSHQVTFELLGQANSSFIQTMTAYTLPGLSTTSRTINWNDRAPKYEHLKNLDLDPHPPMDRAVLLIGTDYAHLFSQSECRKGTDEEPIAFRTPLGWSF